MKLTLRRSPQPSVEMSGYQSKLQKIAFIYLCLDSSIMFMNNRRIEPTVTHNFSVLIHIEIITFYAITVSSVLFTEELENIFFHCYRLLSIDVAMIVGRQKKCLNSSLIFLIVAKLW